MSITTQEIDSLIAQLQTIRQRVVREAREAAEAARKAALDPDLLKAREIVQRVYNRRGGSYYDDTRYLEGRYDHATMVQATMAAIKLTRKELGL